LIIISSSPEVQHTSKTACFFSIDYTQNKVIN